MRNALAVIILAAASIVLYRKNVVKPTVEIHRWQILENEPVFSRSSHNCTFTSCYDTSRCVLNSNELTIYIQPLVDFVDKNGTLISPQPSREFLEIRNYLSPYSVKEPTTACLSLPGVDFLNFDRFRSQDDILRIVSALKNRFPNPIVINFLGKVPQLDVMLISALPGRDAFRHRFDVSIPLLLPETDEKNSEKNEKEELLLIPIVNTSGIQKQAVLKQLGETKATFITECISSVANVCYENGKIANLEQLIREHKFVVLLDSSSIFPRLLTLSLKNGAIPIIYGDFFILPFRDLIEWSNFALLPSSLSRIPHILGRISTVQTAELVKHGRTLYKNSFSSISAIMNFVMKELRTRILPSVPFPEETCSSLLPHIISDPVICGVVIADDYDVVRRVNSLCRSPSLAKIIIFWTSEGSPPSPEEWICHQNELEIVHGGDFSMISEILKKDKECIGIFFVPVNGCQHQDAKLAEAIDMWQSTPHTLLHLSQSSDSNCRPSFLLNSIYLSYCLSPSEISILAHTGGTSLRSIYLTDSPTTTGDANFVLV